ncbi:CYTH domain-containing protein [Agaribacter flavus]|uniref:CYTH domain-containing protein n=1 Tax=Agaribacter flavus TaxID=1902781 RepID=A0ABV7FPD0_9ALTE
MEVELKLAVNGDALPALKDKVLPAIKGSISAKEKEVYNDYFDTADCVLRKHKIGFRVRTQNGRYEQTVKTQGQIRGGLHQRPEYNIELDRPVPDISKFPADIWPDGISIAELGQSVERVFTTNFTRYEFDIVLDNGRVELVYDVGCVETENDKVDINELELELKEGQASILFELAEIISAHLPIRISNTTKAARGYRLVNGQFPNIKALPKFLSLTFEDSTEQGLCKAITCALDHWQYHLSIFVNTGELKALTEIRESMSLLLQSVSLYLPVLQSDDLLRLHRQLLALTQKWKWQDELQAIGRLRSKKGAFSKRIPKDASIMNYLQGRKESLLIAYDPLARLLAKESIELQLFASKMLLEKPWREQTSGADIPVRKHANGWLSQTWQTVMQSLPNEDAMDAGKYLALEVLLKQSLTNGFLLGDLFTESRGTFRMPWLDLQQGIGELKAIAFMRSALSELDIEAPTEFSDWLDEKSAALLEVMEKSRHVAMQAETYW